MPSDPSILTRGGPMMWVLLLMGVIALVLFIERTFYLHRGQIKSTTFVDGIKNALAKRRIVEALTLCEETPGPVAAVVKAALIHAHDDETKMRYAVQEAAVVELPALERRLGSIAAIAQVAPMVGLLGTILGMATTFHKFMQGGEFATAKALSGGMWEALLATAGSLVLAIPAHLAYHFLYGRVRSLVRDIEWSGNEIMRYLLIDYRRGESSLEPSAVVAMDLDGASVKSGALSSAVAGANTGSGNDQEKPHGSNEGGVKPGDFKS